MAMLRAVWVVLLLSLYLTAAEDPPAIQRQPVPDEKAQKDAEVLVRDFFKGDYGRTGPQERGVLAKKLLNEAHHTNTDMDLKFVLLREARTAALDGGHVQLALNALDATGAAFEFDATKEKAELLAQLARSAKTPEAAQNVADACLAIAEQSMEKNQFDETRLLIGQAETAALVEVGQAFVINAEQAQHRGVEIVNVDAVSGDVVTEVIRLAIDHAWLHSTSGQPGCETARMMIAPVIVRRQLAL